MKRGDTWEKKEKNKLGGKILSTLIDKHLCKLNYALCHPLTIIEKLNGPNITQNPGSLFKPKTLLPKDLIQEIIPINMIVVFFKI